MTTKDTIKENLDYSIFDLLNCYEIDGTEIKGGMAYIDSGEARILTDKLVKIVSSALTKQREDLIAEIQKTYLHSVDYGSVRVDDNARAAYINGYRDAQSEIISNLKKGNNT